MSTISKLSHKVYKKTTDENRNNSFIAKMEAGIRAT